MPPRLMIAERLVISKTMDSTARKPSWVPPIIALLSIVLSVCIFAISALRFSPAIYFGYFLTPFMPIICLALARSQVTKSRSNVFYDLATGRKILQVSIVLALLGFIAAFPIMYQIAREFAQI